MAKQSQPPRPAPTVSTISVRRIRNLDSLIHQLQNARLNQDPNFMGAMAIPPVTVTVRKRLTDGAVVGVAVESGDADGWTLEGDQ